MRLCCRLLAKSAQKTLASVVAAAVLVNSAGLVEAAQASVWSDRRAAPVRTAALFESGASPNQLLRDIPPINRALGVVPPSSFGRLPSALARVVASVPLQRAAIRDVYVSPSAGPHSPFLLLIQDVHLNVEAQQNIAGVLEAVAKNAEATAAHPLFVAVEGASGPFDFTVFHGFKSQRIPSEVATAYLNGDRISAASYVGIASEEGRVFVDGIDDPDGYRANVDAYRASRPLVPSVKRRLGDLERSLDERKSRVLHGDLAKLDGLLSGHGDGTIGLGAYISSLAGMEGARGRPQELVVEQFLAAYETEQSLDFGAVERERAAVVEKLARHLSDDELKDLVAESLAYRAGQISHADYYRAVKELIARHHIDLRDAPAFDRYIGYVLLADGINADHLMAAVRALEERAVADLCRTDEERACMRESRWLRLAGKLVDFGLTPDEWTEWKGQRGTSPASAPDLVPFERFYAEADKRSERMVDNVAAAIRSREIDHGNDAAMVIGGFHTPQVTALLRQRGLSYAVLQPKVTKVDAQGGTAYLSIFAREKTPLDQLFEGQKLFLAPDALLAGRTPAITRELALLIDALERAAGEQPRSVPGLSITANPDGSITARFGQRELRAAAFGRPVPPGFQTVGTLDGGDAGKVQVMVREEQSDALEWIRSRLKMESEPASAGATLRSTLAAARSPLAFRVTVAGMVMGAAAIFGIPLLWPAILSTAFVVAGGLILPGMSFSSLVRAAGLASREATLARLLFAPLYLLPSTLTAAKSPLAFRVTVAGLVMMTAAALGVPLLWPSILSVAFVVVGGFVLGRVSFSSFVPKARLDGLTRLIFAPLYPLEILGGIFLPRRFFRAHPGRTSDQAYGIGAMFAAFWLVAAFTFVWLATGDATVPQAILRAIGTGLVANVAVHFLFNLQALWRGQPTLTMSPEQRTKLAGLVSDIRSGRDPAVTASILVDFLEDHIGNWSPADQEETRALLYGIAARFPALWNRIHGTEDLHVRLPVLEGVETERGVRYSPGGRWLSIGRRLINRATGESHPLAGVDQGRLSFRFSPNGRRAVVGQSERIDGPEQFSLVDPETGGLIPFSDLGVDPVLGTEFSPDGRTVAMRQARIGYGDQWRLFNAETGALILFSGLGTNPVNRIRFSPDGTTAAVRQQIDGVDQWRLINPITGAVIPFSRLAKNPITDIQFSPDGRRAALRQRTGDGYQWRLINPVTGALIPLSGVGKKPVIDVKFSPDGRHVAMEQRIRGRDQWRLIDALTGALMPFPGFDAAPVTELEFSPDGQTLAVFRRIGDDYQWRLINLTTGALIEFPDFGEDWPGAVRFGPDGRSMEVTLGSGWINNPYYRRLMNPATGALIPFSGLGVNPVNKIQFSPDGRIAAVLQTIDGEEQWRLINLATGALIPFSGLGADSVGLVRFSPDGRTAAVLVRIGDEAQWRLINAATGAWIPVSGLGTNRVDEIQFSPDGQEVALILADGSRVARRRVTDLMAAAPPQGPPATATLPSTLTAAKSPLAFRVTVAGLVMMTAAALGVPLLWPSILSVAFVVVGGLVLGRVSFSSFVPKARLDGLTRLIFAPLYPLEILGGIFLPRRFFRAHPERTTGQAVGIGAMFAAFWIAGLVAFVVLATVVNTALPPAIEQAIGFGLAANILVHFFFNAWFLWNRQPTLTISDEQRRQFTGLMDAIRRGRRAAEAFILPDFIEEHAERLSAQDQEEARALLYRTAARVPALWDLIRNRENLHVRTPALAGMERRGEVGTTWTYSPGGRWLMVGRRLIDRASGASEEITGLGPEPVTGPPHFSPDGHFVAVRQPGPNGRLGWHLISLDTREVVTVTGLGTERLIDIPYFSADGRFAVVQQRLNDGLLHWRLVNLATREVITVTGLGTEPVIGTSYFSEDGRFVAVRQEINGIRQWRLVNLHTGNVVAVSGLGTEPVRDASFSPDGRLAAVRQEIDGVGQWRLVNLETRGVITVSGLGTEPVVQILFSPEGRFMIALHEINGIRQWRLVDLETREVVPLGDGLMTGTAYFSPNGRFVVVEREIDGRRQWQLNNLETREVITAAGLGTEPVLLSRFSPDGRFVAVEQAINGIPQWRLITSETGDVVTVPGLGPEPVIGIPNFSPDGRFMAVVQEINGARRWRLVNLATQEVANLTGQAEIYAFSPDGQEVLLSLGDDQVARRRVADLFAASPQGPPSARTVPLPGARPAARTPSTRSLPSGHAVGRFFSAPAGAKVLRALKSLSNARTVGRFLLAPVRIAALLALRPFLSAGALITAERRARSLIDAAVSLLFAPIYLPEILLSIFSPRLFFRMHPERTSELAMGAGAMFAAFWLVAAFSLVALMIGDTTVPHALLHAIGNGVVANAAVHFIFNAQALVRGKPTLTTQDRRDRDRAALTPDQRAVVDRLDALDFDRLPPAQRRAALESVLVLIAPRAEPIGIGETLPRRAAAAIVTDLRARADGLDRAALAAALPALWYLRNRDGAEITERLDAPVPVKNGRAVQVQVQVSGATTADAAEKEINRMLAGLPADQGPMAAVFAVPTAMSDADFGRLEADFGGRLALRRNDETLDLSETSLKEMLRLAEGNALGNVMVAVSRTTSLSDRAMETLRTFEIAHPDRVQVFLLLDALTRAAVSVKIDDLENLARFQRLIAAQA